MAALGCFGHWPGLPSIRNCGRSTRTTSVPRCLTRGEARGPSNGRETLSAPQSRKLLLGPLLELSCTHCTRANFPTVKIFSQCLTEGLVIAWIHALFTALCIYMHSSSKALYTGLSRIHFRLQVALAGPLQFDGEQTTAKQHLRLHGCDLPVATSYCAIGKFAPQLCPGVDLTGSAGMAVSVLCMTRAPGSNNGRLVPSTTLPVEHGTVLYVLYVRTMYMSCNISAHSSHLYF